MGPQSYIVGVPNERGFVTPLLTGIHLPQRTASLASPETDGDPFEITEPRTAAIWCVYNNPQILTLDTKVAARVVDHITQTDSFNEIVTAVQNTGPALTPEQAAQGDSGWIAGEYVLDGKGEQIQQTKLDGTPVTDDKGAPVYVYRWVLDKTVEAATTVVVAHHEEATSWRKWNVRQPASPVSRVQNWIFSSCARSVP